MRPVYENQVDRDAEEAVAKSLGEFWRTKYTKLPKSYHVDYMLSNGSGVARAWLEVKCRSRWYDTMMISLNKFLAGTRVADATGLAFLMAYSVDGEIRYVRLESGDLTGDRGLYVSVGGRTDRGDSQDIEPVVMIPLGLLKKLGEA